MGRFLGFLAVLVLLCVSVSSRHSLHHRRRSGSSAKDDGPPAAYRFAITSHTINGVHMEVGKLGHGEHKVVLLHGFPEVLQMWEPVVQRFCLEREKTPSKKSCFAKYTFYAPNQRGVAGSVLKKDPKTVHNYNSKFLVEDIRSLITDLVFKDQPLGKVLLVTHDFGGFVGWAFAATHPALLNGLAVFNCPQISLFINYIRTSPKQQNAARYLNWFVNYQSLVYYSFKLAWYAIPISTFPEETTDYLKAHLRKAFGESWDTMLMWYPANCEVPDGDFSQSNAIDFPTASIPKSVPVFVGWGEADDMYLEENVIMLQENQKAEKPIIEGELTVKLYPGVQHFSPVQVPNLVGADVLKFANNCFPPEEPGSKDTNSETDDLRN